MATETLKKTMTGDEMIALSKKHTLFEWSAQSKVDPIPVERAKGIYFWTPEGKRFIDFNSQLMCVNIGHGDERVIRAIGEQASVLAYANPFMATEPRARLGAKLAEIAPGDIDVFFFTNGVLIPPDGYMQGVRKICDQHGILMICDEVMAGFGRTGEWFAINHWNVIMVVPPLVITPEEVRAGLELLDTALEVADAAYEG